MAEGLTRALGHFTSELRPEAIPAEALAVVRMGFADCLGVMVAGGDDPSVGAVRQVFCSGAGSGASSVLLSQGIADAPAAALVNGTAAHALDYDDVAMRGHVSAVLVPAILAEAESIGASGADMMAAYVAGYETWAEIGRRLPQALHLKGWHPTSVFGSLAAAAACANLRRLDAATTANALSLAASQASGLTVNFGTGCKPFHAGRAAQVGIVSARLAAAGLNGAADALENERGFLAAFCPEGEPDRTSPADRLGQNFEIVSRRLNLKRYPVCYAAHRPLDAVLELKSRHAFSGDGIVRIVARIGAVQAAMLKVERPSTPLEAKFSLRFCLAAACAFGDLGLDHLRESSIRDAQVQRLMALVEVETTRELDPAFPNYAPYDQVWVFLANGEVLESRRVSRAKGHADNPLSESELEGKLEDCLSSAMPPAARGRLIEALRNLEGLRRADEIARSVADEPPAVARRQMARMEGRA